MTGTTSSRVRLAAAALLCAALAAGCATAQAPAGVPDPGTVSGTVSVAERVRADSLRRPYTEADVRFMTDMIGHHAQALVMARMAPTHDASPSVRTLAARIINAQQDEIAIMQQWLRDRGRPVPDPASPAAMEHHGHGGQQAHGEHQGHAGHHEALMPGMLTAAQLRELDEARGAEFDRKFLVFMIQHHRGAVAMVKQLFSTHGAGQDEMVFKFASDVNVDQTTEIDRMEKMLAALVFGL